VALGNPYTVDYKLLLPREGGPELKVMPKRPDEATQLIAPALVGRPQEAAESFGHVRYRALSERIARRLAAAGAEEEAAQTVDKAIETLAARIPDDRPAKAGVIASLEQTREEVAGRPRAKAKQKTTA